MAELTACPASAAAPMSRRRASLRRLAPLAMLPPVAAALEYVPAFDPTDRVPNPLDLTCAMGMYSGRLTIT